MSRVPGLLHHQPAAKSSLLDRLKTFLEPSLPWRWPWQRRMQEQPKLAKRKLALHLGYVGTGFKGLQIQAHVQPDLSVEASLVKALFEAGAILETNMGPLSRIKWSRSSRTDKGVHSLATVVAAKLEIDDAVFVADGEGSTLAAEINKRLPSELRVFSAQRVNNGFNAREKCDNRAYAYYLPARLLGWVGDGREADAAALARFREALAAFEGTHAFHCYTQRKRYRVGVHIPRRGLREKKINSWEAADEDDEVEAGEEEGEEEGEDWEEPKPGVGQEMQSAEGGTGNSLGKEGKDAPGTPPRGTAASSKQQQPLSSPAAAPRGISSAAAAAGGDPSSQEGDAVMQSAEGQGQEGLEEAEGKRPEEAPPGAQRPWPIPCQWVAERDLEDLVTSAHHRTMHDVSAAGDPQPLVPGGPPCLKVTIHGQSFLLHQIRHMLGAAICVARGMFPLEWLKASICPPARTVPSLVPSEGLLLEEAHFFPFASSSPAQDPVRTLSGERLQLRERGLAARTAFDQEVLRPALSALLEAPVWQRWEANLGRMVWEPAELQAFLAAYRAYAEREPEREQRRAERRERMAEERRGERPPPGRGGGRGAAAERGRGSKGRGGGRGSKGSGNKRRRPSGAEGGEEGREGGGGAEAMEWGKTL